MIKINLASKKQGAAVSEGTAAGGAAGKDPTQSLFKFDTRLDGLKDLPIRQFVALVVGVIVVWYFVEDYKQGEITKVSEQIAKLDAEELRLKTELGKTSGYEALKAALDKDEKEIRTKIATVQKLIEDRQTPPKLLLALSTTIPNDVWLAAMKIVDDEVTFDGTAFEFAQIPDFMKNLNENAFFTDIQLKNTQQAKEDGADVAKFQIVAKRRRTN